MALGKVDPLNILKLTTSGLAGLFAGGGLYINVVDIPAERKVSDTESARRFWKESFLRAKNWQGGIAAATILSSGAIFFLDDADNKKLWLIGSGIFATILPWTLFVMKPDIKRLLEDNVVRERGSDWVRTKIEAWNKQHMYRSLVGVTVFGIFLYASSRS